MISIPKVVLHGYLCNHEGAPITGRCRLVPRHPVGAVLLGDHLVSTATTAFTPSADGTFAIKVMPTDIGGPAWHYELLASNGAVYRIQLPARYPVNDLQKMLSQGSR